MDRATKSKNQKFTITTVLLVLVICIALAEVGIRTYHFTCERQRFIWLPDQFLGYIHSSDNKFKHSYTEGERITIDHQTNSLGFIGDEVNIEKEEGTFRIIVLGDSFSEAMQVPSDKNFSGRLQYLLNNHPHKKNKKFEVLNTGVSGYSPLNYYLYFKRELAQLKPDLVLVQMFANDVFEDNTATSKSLLDEDGLPLKTGRYFSEKYFDHPPVSRKDFNNNPIGYQLMKFLIDRSRMFEYFYVKAYNAKKASLFHRETRAMSQFETGYQFFILDPNHILSRDENFRKKAWGYTQQYLVALKKEIEKQQSQFQIFYIPMEAQLDLDHYGQHAELYVQKHMGMYFNNLLKDFAQSHNIHFLDLLRDFEQHKNRGLYLSRDGHLTKTGHEVAAESLFNYIIGNNLLNEVL